jgi:SOS response regulatory protein OraA/RecX
MRNYYSAALQKKLEQKGFSRPVSERVVADCKRLGFLKDDEFILAQFRRGYGPRYIEFKWRVSRPTVRALISRSMQREKILQLLPKLGPREKAMRALQRRGFDLDIVVEIFS